MMGEPEGLDGAKPASSRKEHSRDVRVPSLGRAIALLLAAIGFPSLLWSWFEYSAHGAIGMASVALPAVICAGSGCVALLLTSLGGSQRTIGPLLASLLVRTFLPMAACVAILSAKSPLVAHGLLWKFLAFYLLSLTAETILAVVLLKKTDRGRSRVVTNAHHGYR